MKTKLGAPSKLTPELQEALCLAIRSTKISIADAAEALGIARSTIFDWIRRGELAKKGRFYEFSVAIRRARADGTKALLARVALAGKEPRHWQANLALLSATEPGYSPRVRVQVEGELKEIYEQLKREFANEPATLERIIRTLAGETSQEEQPPTVEQEQP